MCSIGSNVSSADFTLGLSLLIGVLLIWVSSKFNALAKNERVMLSIITVIAIMALFLFFGFWFEDIGIYEINNVPWRKAGIGMSFFVLAACISIMYAILFEPAGLLIGEIAGYALWALSVIAQIITIFEYADTNMIFRPALSALMATLYGTFGTALLVSVYIKKRS